jgi:hypothetical protein
MDIFESSSTDVLGLWTGVPQSTGLSFGLDSDGTQTGPFGGEGEFYRTNLPTDSEAARDIFATSTSHFERVEGALSEVPGRLDTLVANGLKVPAKGTSDASFSTGELPNPITPEDELVSMLAAARAGEDSTAQSFGIGDSILESWEIFRAQFEALLALVERDVLHFAWVETNVGGEIVARTSINWGGDVQTIFAEDVERNRSSLHEHTLGTVIRTRHLRLRLAVTVAGGAVKIAAALGGPAGPFLALPAVYQFVTSIVAQAAELQSIQ